MSDKKKRKISKPFCILKRIIDYLFLYYKVQICIVLLLIILNAASGIGASVMLKKLIDGCLVPIIGRTNPNFEPAIKVIILIGLIYYSGLICGYLYNCMMIKITRGTTRNIRVELFDHLEKLPINYFDTRPHGDIMSVFNNDTDTLRQLISQSIPQLVSSIVIIVGTMIAMFVLNKLLFLISLLMAVAMYFIGKMLTKKSSFYFQEQQKNFGALNGYAEEMIYGQKEIKLFSYEEKNIERFKQYNEKLAVSAIKANLYGNIIFPLISNLNNITYLLTALVGIGLAFKGINGFSLGVLAAFLQLCRMFNQPISQITQQINYIIAAVASSERMFSLLDETVETDDGVVSIIPVEVLPDGKLVKADRITGKWGWQQNSKAEQSITMFNGDIELNNVNFAYPGGESVLRSISIKAINGEKIAFVGPTGAGKTTIANLINRFYDLNSGSILFDGIDIKNIRKQDIRRVVGVVLQETRLFTGTIKDNIIYGNKEATEDSMIVASKQANAHDFIINLPEKYDTVLTNNGSNLSEGERQLIAIARAIIANPPILILDEATSKVDTRTELIVQKGMKNLMKNRTVFIIAHRLSTIRTADLIMVLNNGQIIERGTHDELIGENGMYSQLYQETAL